MASAASPDRLTNSLGFSSATCIFSGDEAAPYLETLPPTVREVFRKKIEEVNSTLWSRIFGWYTEFHFAKTTETAKIVATSSSSTTVEKTPKLSMNW